MTTIALNNTSIICHVIILFVVRKSSLGNFEVYNTALLTVILKGLKGLFYLSISHEVQASC